MASEGRLEDDHLGAVLEIVRREGGGHFRAVVAFLERALRTPARVGEDGPVFEEPIRFRADPSLSFAASDISAVVATNPAHAGPPVEVVTTFLGLTGAVSPLPSYMAEEVAQEPAHEPVLRDFYDIFHHRMMSLAYRGMTRYAYPGAVEPGFVDDWSRRLLAFTGIDVYEHPAATELPMWQILRLAALLAVRRPTAWVIERALADVLATSLDGVPVEVVQFAGAWVPIDASEQTRLGERNSRLGRDFVVGREAFDVAGKLRIRVGPCSREVFYRFREDPHVHLLARETVKLFCRDPLEIDLGLVLAADQLAGMRLSSRSRQRLGVDTFLGAQGASEVIVPLRAPG